MAAEGFAVPPAKVDEPALRTQISLVVVDPVTGKRTSAVERAFHPAIGVQGEAQRGPSQGCTELNERGVPHGPWGGHAGASSNRLREGHVISAHVGIGSQGG